MESGYYPPGAEFDPRAPYNQVDLPEKEIEVTISVTLSKTVKITVDDYEVDEGKDEDGYYCNYDFSECNLQKAVEDQIVLPQNLAKFTEEMFNQDLNLKAAGMPRYLKDAIADCKGWIVDEMEVISEE